MRSFFVTAQVGLSLLLLLTAGLFLRSLRRAATIDTGFEAGHVQTVSFDLSIDGYDAERGRAFLDEALTRMRGLPGVEAAGTAIDLPLDMGVHESPVYPEEVAAGGRESAGAAFNRVSDGYFEALRIPLLRGRSFTAGDRAGTGPVAVVSRTLAEQIWPGENPVGKRIRFEMKDSGPWLTVVGEVADVKEQSIMEAPRAEVYLPVRQAYAAEMTLAVRSAVSPATVAPAIRRTLHELDPRLSITSVQSLEATTALGILPQRIAVAVTGSLGLLALLLSAMGVYGVVAYTVAQRTREIGIRVALGARRRDVLGLVLRGGLRLAVPGMIVGVLLGLGLNRVVRSLLLGVATGDPITFATVPLALLLVVAAASWVPARRAATIEPIAALRTE